MDSGEMPRLAATVQNRQRFPLQMRLLAVSVGLVLLGIMLNAARIHHASVGTICLCGRIEAPESRVASLVPGRIEQLLVQEGDSVSARQLLAVVSNPFISKSEQSTEAELRMVNERLQAGHEKIEKLKKKIAEETSEGLNSQFEPRYPTTAPSRFLHIVNLPFRLLTKPFSSKMNFATRVKSEMGSMKLESLQLGLSVAEAEVEQDLAVRSKLSIACCQSRESLNQCKIYSPVAGVCSARLVNEGSVIRAGQVLLLLRNPKQTYMRGFVPEGQISALRLGQDAIVFLDKGAKQKEKKRAYISAIDDHPVFAPEDIYFQDEKVKQVFGVNLRLANPDGSAKPGMPCSAEIFTGEGAVK